MSCDCRKRPNLTPQVDFILIVVMLLGLKFLGTRLMVAMIALYLVHYGIVFFADRRNR
jgi:hypothetical protein